MSFSMENEVARFWFEDGILCSAYNVNYVDLDVAKEGVRMRHSISKGQSYLLFVDIRNIKGITKEARDYLATSEAIDLLQATAFLTSSYLNVLITKFFLTFNKPNLPTQLFTDKKDAINWLKKFEAKAKG